nr:MAG TPA: hypothetical protein [Caudoviricetes sp.]
MGFLSRLGKAGLGLAKFTGKVTSGGANIAGKKIVNYGSNVISNAMKNPLKTAAAIGAAGAAGYVIGDIEDLAQPSQVAGSAMLGAAAVSAIPGAAAVGTALGAGIVGTGAAIGGLAYGLGRASVKLPNEPISFSNMGDIKFTNLGKGLVVGGALYEGVGRAANKYVQGRMGTNDGMMRTSTPIIPQSQSSGSSYSNNGGATGDLVFAMYNNR